MKKALLSVCLLTSLSFAQVNFESSILNKIKEETGIKDTKEEVYYKFLEKELNKYFNYYVKSKKIKKTDEKYLEISNKIKNLKSLKDVFASDFINNYISLGNKFMSSDKIYLSELIFKLSVREPGDEFLKIYLANSSNIKYIGFNYNYSSLDEDSAKNKIKLIFTELKANKPLLTAFIKSNNDFSKRNSLMNIENVLKYNYIYDIYFLRTSKVNELKVNPLEYLYLIQNEKRLKNMHRGVFQEYKKALDIDLANKIDVTDSKYIISKEPLFKVKEYSLTNFYLAKYTIKIPLINYLLKAAGPEDIYFSNYLNLYTKGLTGKTIKNTYKALYEIEPGVIEVTNLSEAVISFHKGKYYKTFEKAAFNKKFSKFIGQ